MFPTLTCGVFVFSSVSASSSSSPVLLLTHSSSSSPVLLLTHSLTHTLTHSLTHSHTPPHSLTHSLAHSLAPSLPPSLPPSLTHSLTHTLTHSLTHSRPGVPLKQLKSSLSQPLFYELPDSSNKSRHRPRTPGGHSAPIKGCYNRRSMS